VKPAQLTARVHGLGKDKQSAVSDFAPTGGEGPVDDLLWLMAGCEVIRVWPRNCVADGPTF
jgi:hypothetical protein